MNGNGTAKQRRPIEREYLATLNEAVPLDAWRDICKRAADDALAGLTPDEAAGLDQRLSEML